MTYKAPLDLVFIGVSSLTEESTRLLSDLLRWGLLSGTKHLHTLSLSWGTITFPPVSLRAVYLFLIPSHLSDLSLDVTVSGIFP